MQQIKLDAYVVPIGRYPFLINQSETVESLYSGLSFTPTLSFLKSLAKKPRHCSEFSFVKIFLIWALEIFSDALLGAYPRTPVQLVI